MSEWRTVELGEVINFKNGYAFKSADFIESGIPVIKIKNVKPNRVNLDDLSYVSESVAEGKERYLIEPSDILISMSGNRIDGSPDSWVGKVSKFRLKGAYLLNQRVSIIQARDGVSDPDFLAYSLSAWDTQQYLVNHANSSGGQANISPDIVKAMEIVLPSLPEQKAIATVLSSFDDKIDLLSRQKKTLEAMAETLFRQWFVEDAQEAWDEGKVEDLFVLQRGFDLPAQNRTDGPYPIYAASGYSGGHSEYRVQGPGVTTGRSGLLGKVFFVLEDFWPLNTSLYVREFRRGTPLYSYFFLKTLDLNSFNAGSAVPTLNRNHVHEERVLIPPADLIARFETTAFPLFQKIRQNEKQIKGLERLRDTLLPKLMSGEVRVEV
ncbi:MAG: restriction endonuclease subunit S [Betaproteobacteria bacterium]|nr:restriction endonuclease subunit S [Betaproteobacteria bacterium]MDE2422586.1 restriction endonuclease subunit S [Betaproteobacteria bacterium]